MSFDVQAICRCCLSDRTDQLQTIFEDHVLGMFSMCTGIKPTLDDGLPSKICSQCVFKCISWDSFKQLCERTESMLRTQLNIRPATPKELLLADATSIDDNEEDIGNEKDDVVTAIPLNETVEASSAADSTVEVLQNASADSVSQTGLNDAVSVDLQVDFQSELDFEIIEHEADCNKSVDDVLETETITNDNEECAEDGVDSVIQMQIVKMNESGDESFDDNESNGVAQSSQTKPAASTALECPTCQKSFPNRRRLNKHMHIHVVGLPFQCDRCDRSYKLKSSLSLHSRCHRDDIQPYVCDLCGKTFLRAHGLQSHQLSHSTELPFGCDLCEKRFKNEVMLRNHQLRHDSVKRFMCDECGMGFVTSAELRTHSRKHTGLKPFACDECPKSYKTKTHLTVHMRTHTGDRPFGCEFCGQTFAHKKVYTQHRMTHTGEKPHTCETCQKTFRQRSTLLSHMKTHTNK